MKNKGYWFLALVVLLAPGSVFGQEGINNPPKTQPTPTKVTPNTDPKQTNEISRERREQAYAKLLEGQRYIWGLINSRTQAGRAASARLAKDSLQKAVELDPTLSEGYTALAELSFNMPPNDIEEAIRLATIAVKLNPNNFGGHQILARLYTIKSRLNRGILDEGFAQKSIQEWEEVGRLDPRNAEAFAFLGEFYDKTNQPKKRIAALKKWLSSATPLDSRFFRGITQEDNLAPESALVKLGAALLKEGETREAVEILSRAVADDPNSDEAVELLSRAIEEADGKTAAMAVESLQQAIFANPVNTSLPVLLAQVQARSGNLDEAAKTLRTSILKLAEKDKVSAAQLQMALGDLYRDAGRIDEAAGIYKNALAIRGIENDRLVTDEDREFAYTVYERIIQTYKNANRPNEVKKAIDEAKILFGKDDLFADKQLISFYRENGQRTEALQTIRGVRTVNPQDFELLRTEASVLTDLGRVDEGVALLRNLIGKKELDSNSPAVVPAFDDFYNYLYISSLYSQAKRGKEAIEAANQAVELAKRDDRKQVARLTLATAQQTAGNFAEAETTLREILKQNPGYPVALNNLGYFLIERNEKLQEALSLIQKAVEIDPTNPSYLDSLGWAYFKLGKLEEAEKYLLSAVRLSEGSPTILEHLGDVYHKQGKAELARSTWQRALKLTADKEEMNRLKGKLQGKGTK